MPQVNFGHVVVWAEAADRLVQGLELKGVCSVTKTMAGRINCQWEIV